VKLIKEVLLSSQNGQVIDEPLLVIVRVNKYLRYGGLLKGQNTVFLLEVILSASNAIFIGFLSSVERFSLVSEKLMCYSEDLIPSYKTGPSYVGPLSSYDPVYDTHVWEK